MGRPDVAKVGGTFQILGAGDLLWCLSYFHEVNDLEMKVNLLQNEKMALEKAKQELSSELAKIKRQLRLKYQ